jgi:hypothetical protein
VLWYNQVYLSSASPQTSARALDILVHHRIPHHAVFVVLGYQAPFSLNHAGGLIAHAAFHGDVLLFAGGLLVSLVQILTGNS